MRKRMKLSYAAAILLWTSTSFAQLKLIPTPQKVEMNPDRVHIPFLIHLKTTRVVEPISAVNSDQAYRLVVSQNGFELQYTGDAGKFYGTQTWQQLLNRNARSDSIPCCEITDWPALKYRV